LLSASSRNRSKAALSRVPRGRKLARVFYDTRALVVARGLIGMHLVHRVGGRLRVGRIVETEAYQGPLDLAAHSARGRRTARTEVMFGPPGHAYVYFIYGFWNCLNVVTAAEGTPHAVLLRALEPVANVTRKTSGPGLLCRALGIDRRLNGADLCGVKLWIERPAEPRRARIRRSTRIGVDYAGDWAHRPWRFYDADSLHVSRGPQSGRTRKNRGREEIKR
jgi:DNA-3-methyladenine glycosylase